MGAAPSKSLNEILEENKNAIRTATREIDREIRGIQRRENEVQRKIKESAKKGRVNEVKIFAKDLVRIRKAVEKLELTKANLDGIRVQMMTASGQEAIMRSMKSAVGCYRQLNQVMDPAAMQKILAEYQKESMRQEIQQEIMDGVMADNDDEGEIDDLVNQTLHAIGVEISEGMVKMTNQGVANAAQQNPVDAELSSRLNNL